MRLATFHRSMDLRQFDYSELQQKVEPKLFIQSLKALVNPRTLEADFGEFILNVGGVLEPLSDVEVSEDFLSSFKTKPKIFCTRYSQPSKWDEAQYMVFKRRFGNIENSDNKRNMIDMLVLPLMRGTCFGETRVPSTSLYR